MALYKFYIDGKNSPITSRSHAEHGNQLRSGALIFAIAIFCSAHLSMPSFAHAEDFDWTTIGAAGGGLNFVSPVQDQGASGMCWAFAAVGMLEAKYKITRNDPNYNIDLSELQLAAANVGSYTFGGNTDSCTTYFQSTGLVTESVFPWQSTDLSPNWPGWSTVSSQISSGQVGTVKTSGSRNWIKESTAQIKADLKNYGPLGVAIQVDNDWYNPSPRSYRGGHEVVITGYHDNVGSENAPGGGYFIIKNSWGSDWNGNGYGQIAYATLSNTRILCMITSGAYFTTALQTVTWDTSTSSGYQPGAGNWSTTGGNWSADGTTLAAWRNGEDAAVFDGGGGVYAINVDNGISAHAVTFNSGASGYTLNGGTLTITTGGMAVNENVTMNTGVTVGGAQTWSIAAGKVLTVNANINTHISPLTINSIGDTVINGAISDVHGDSMWNGLLTGSSGSLTKSGTGTLTLAGNNTYTGDTAITAGMIRLDHTPAGLSEAGVNSMETGAAYDVNPGAGSLFSVSNTLGGNMSPVSTVIMSSNTTLDLNNYSTTVGALANSAGILTNRVLLGSATLTTGGNGKSTSFSGVISGSGGLIKIGTGTQTLSGVNTYQAGTIFNGGYLAVPSLDTLGSGGLTFNGGGLKFTGIFDPTTRVLAINSGGAAFDTNNYTITLNNPLSGTGGVTKVGAGTLIYNVANSYSGNTAITGGILKAGTANVIPGGSGNGNVSVAYGAALDLSSYSQNINGLSGLGTVDNTAGTSTYTISVGGNNADSQFSGSIRNSYGKINLNKTGAGTLTVGGFNNTYTGATLITGGTIKLGPTAPGLYEGMLPSYFDLSSTNPKTALQLTTVSANTSIPTSQTWVYSGYINNPGAASATWIFAENYHDGARLFIDGEQILYSTVRSDQTTGIHTLTPGLHTFELRVGGRFSPVGPNGSGVNGTGLGVAFDTGDGRGYRALTDPGDGSLFHLTTDPNGSLPSATPVVMSSNTTFDLNNYSTTIGSLSDADGTPAGHQVLLGSGTLNLGGNGASTIFSGVISGSGGINKNGAGIFTIKGVNTYTGPTSIYSGTLKLDSAGSIAGNVIDVKAGTFDVSSLSNYSLNYGQTIKGNGSILGSMTVLGTVQPGESPGILNTGNVIFGSGSMLDIELAGTTPGTLYDVLNSSGAINLQNGSEFKLSLLNGYTPSEGDTFDVLNFSSLSGMFSILDLPSLAGGDYWNLDSLYQNGTLSVVPEPATLAILLIAFATIACWRYTRKRCI
jgi:autotransporter-associated beta strand protein